jgi:hypothetical protein
MKLFWYLAGLVSGVVFLYLPTKRTLDRRNVQLIRAMNKVFSLADTQPIEVKP